ncbi:MAG: hypothetical protein IFK94_03170 [Acidobacteria bacterium]|uniref:Semialdehyde dehydrogenase dimerisation domain-containing protein n=1 Tax=Candidatus Polarisedimenticola svalbardensis TaxID=2886004 RepID=A0A8J6XRB9_9BACT|nr:hypothetical protein [Candidatus Polarisedimenticola svalbardensis]
MTPSRVDPAEATGRIALVGAGSPEGHRLRKVLETMQVPGSRIDLFGAGETVLSEYDGEARMIQEADRAALEEHRLIFICDTAADAGRFLTDPAPRAITIDLTGAGMGLGLPLIHDRLLPPGDHGPGSALVVAHSLSLLLADILAPIHRGPGIESASAVILRPAADFGDGAVDELRQQTVNLLNFGSPPVGHLGRQLAFNVVPSEYITGGSAVASERVASESARLVGSPPVIVSVDMVAVPMFYGHGVNLQVTTREPVTPEALYGLLDAVEGLKADAADSECTPVEVSGRGGISITAIRAEAGGNDRFRLWAAADEAEAGSAVQAIRLARQLGVL